MADSFEEEPEPTVSIGDYLKEVEEQELEADLVLGGDEGKECTYSKGYMKRQAIFSCLTCTPDGSAGFCTACSMSCHDGHEIVELWTKRNFRCDCGNSKFGEFFCKLYPSKDENNLENSYNHNFKGFYCTCGLPYPDPDAEEQVEMIQCCICEDWFHEEHLGLESPDVIPRDEEGQPLYEEFICQGCSIICSFLTLYPQTIWAACISADAGDSTSAKNAKEKDTETSVQGFLPSSSSAAVVSEKHIPVEQDHDNNAILNQCINVPCESKKCILGLNLVEFPFSQGKGKPMFLSKNWREALCRCENCMKFYVQKGINFLLDREDSIAEYEQMAKQKREEKLQEQQDEELSFLNRLGHVEKIEFLSGVNDMKTELTSFLGSFDESKPVTAAHIHEFFDNLAKKRRRME